MTGSLSNQQTKNIMIIDDSSTIRKIVEITLRREGYLVHSFPDGVDAMRSFQHPDTQIPDLVTLDIDLPKMNGYEIARHLRSKPAWRDIPIIMLTHYNGVVDRLKARLTGIQLYLPKPVKTQTLIQTVQVALSKKSASDARQPTQTDTYYAYHRPQLCISKHMPSTTYATRKQ